MASTYVAFFPSPASLSPEIHEFRDRNDPKAALVAPHATLVFPTARISQEWVLREAQRVALEFTAFPAVFRTALAVPQGDGQATVFLVPDAGFGDVVRLHARLYSGLLKPELRLDVAFIPHITVGSGLTLEDAKAAMDKLNGLDFRLEIVVDQLDVVSIVAPHEPRRIVAGASLLRAP